MKTMLLILGLTATSAFAASGPLSITGSGRVDFEATNFMADCGYPSLPTGPGSDDSSSLNCDNSNPHYAGELHITGEAAEKMYVAMNAVKVHPEAADVDNKTNPGWDDIEYKSGKDILCFKKPGKSATGKPTRTTACLIRFTSFSEGQLK